MERLEIDIIEALVKDKSFQELNKEELHLIRDTFENEKEYTAYHNFILELNNDETIDFPEEIDAVVYDKLNHEEDVPFILPAIFKYAAIAIIFLGLGFSLAWFARPKPEIQIVQNNTTNYDTIRLVEKLAILDTIIIREEIVKTELLEVIVYQERDEFNGIDSAMLIADSIPWKENTIVQNNNLKDREDLNAFYLQ